MTSWKAATLTMALLLAVTACSRQPAVETLDDSTTDGQQLPFERAPNRKGFPPAVSVAEIPAGTPITIRLQSPLSSASSRQGEAFEAVLDEPIVIRGKTVVHRGAMIAGRVAAAKPSDGEQTAGYLRLTLSAIALNGKSQPIQTSSIFAKGGAREVLPEAPEASIPGEPHAGAADIQFPPNHRLTFRLKETLPGQP